MEGEFLSQFSVFWLISGSQSPEPGINLWGLEARNPVSFLSCSGYFDISYNLTTHLTYASDSSTAGPGQLTSRALYCMDATNGSSTLPSLSPPGSLPPSLSGSSPLSKNLPHHCQEPPHHCQAPLSLLSGISIVVIRHLPGHCQAPPSSLSGTSLITVRHLPPHCQAAPSSPSGTSLITIRYLPCHCQVPPSSSSNTSLIAVKHCPQWVLFVIVSGSLSILPALLLLLLCCR